MSSSLAQGVPGAGSRPRRRRILGLDADVVTQRSAVERIAALAAGPARGHLVVTPNLDHALLLRRHEGLRSAYARAALVLPDGKPLVWLSRLDGGPPLELVTGSDLILPLCRAAERRGLSVFLFGSTEDTLARAAEAMRRECPALRLAGTHAPPMGFLDQPEAVASARSQLLAARPDIVFVALGAPRQELWSLLHGQGTGAGVFVCIGAGLDFIAGTRRRAPALIRSIGAEWVWRMLGEPRRLVPRYTRILLTLPQMVMDHWRERA